MTREDLKNYKENKLWIDEQIELYTEMKQRAEGLKAVVLDGMPKAQNKPNYAIEKLLDTYNSILNELVKEQEKELKRLDKEAQQYFETTIKQVQTFDSQLQKKDKMIDLILDVFFKRFTAQLVLEYGIENKEQLKQKFKQFYERKVENEKV